MIQRTPSRALSRRRFLAASVFGSVAASGLLAACGGSAPSAAPAATSAPAAAPTAASVPTAAGAAPTTAAPAAAPTTAAAPTSAAQATTAAVTLNFWKSPHSQQEDQLWQPILTNFESQHPGIKVVHTVIPWNSFDPKFTAAFASGDPPDVFYMPDEWIPKYASQGQMTDLTSLISGEGLKDKYVAQFWGSCTYKGKTYGIPFLAVVQAILINQSLFQSAGLAVPKTWDDIRAAAKKLTDPSKGTYGMHIDGQNTPPPLLAAGGTTVLSEDLTKVAANAAGGVAAFTQAYQNIGAQDKSMVPLSFTADQLTDLRLKGKIGMMWQEESSIVAQFRKQAPTMQLDVIPLPKVDGTSGHDSAWYNVGYMCLSAQGHHLQQATDLLNALITKDVQQTYVIDGVNLIPGMAGVQPANLDPVVAKYLTFIPQGVGPTTSVHWPDVKQKLLQASQAIISGQKTAKQALDDYANEVGSELDGN